MRRNPPCILALVFLSILTAAPAFCGVIAAEDIQTEIIAHLNSSYSQSGWDVEFSVPGAAQVSIPQVGTPVIRVAHEPVELPAKLVPVNVSIEDSSGTVLKQIRQAARVRMFTLAVVAAKDIMRNETITPEVVEVKRIEITGVTDYYESPDDLSGMQSKKILRSGDLITATDIRQPFLVERGNRVDVEVRDEALMLRTVGTARQNGYLGQSISVYIDLTKTVVSGIVIDQHTVLTGVPGD